MSQGRSGRRSGFTLVEILLVCILMGVLFTISFTGFANARDRSANAQIDGNVRSIQQALITYEADNEKFPNALTRVDQSAIGTLNPTDLVLLDRVQDRRYLPGNYLPRTPWTECWQGNNIPVPRYEKAAALWPIAHPNTVMDTVKVPANPTNINDDGALPPNTIAPQAIGFTNATFGAILYESNGLARDRYMLVGVGKSRGAARVVALATNAN